MTDRRSIRSGLLRRVTPETSVQPRHEPADLGLRVRMRQAAFEAVYIAMEHPDPASSRFIALVATHAEHLRAAHRGCQAEQP